MYCVYVLHHHHVYDVNNCENILMSTNLLPFICVNTQPFITYACVNKKLFLDRFKRIITSEQLHGPSAIKIAKVSLKKIIIIQKQPEETVNIVTSLILYLHYQGNSEF